MEEYLRGPAFEQEAEAFLNSTIDNLLARPLSEIVGQIAPEKFELMKRQISNYILELARSPGSVTFNFDLCSRRARPVSPADVGFGAAAH